MAMSQHVRHAVVGIGAAVALVHLGAQLSGGRDLAAVTQVMLVPCLASWLALRTAPGPRGRLVRLFLLALGFSWLGDTAPRFLDGDAGFLAMVGFFLVAQVVYALALWPLRARSAPAHAPWTLAVYGGALVVVLALCAREAGPLLPAVLVYAAALVTTSALAWGLGAAAGIGGVIFLVSDAMIALGAFAPNVTIPQRGFLVMLTYVAAQVILAHAASRHEASRRRVAPAPAADGDAPGS